VSDALRAAIVAEARRWIGTPYVHQASLIHVGCDCLGLARGVWRACVGEEPETPSPYGPFWPLAAVGEPLRDAAHRHLVWRASMRMRPGDLLLFRWRARLPASHVGLLASEGSFVHAHDGAAVAEVALTPWWRRHCVDVFAFPGAAD
jgi:NlpC/P60 family putative phage cell wall peptidase